MKADKKHMRCQVLGCKRDISSSNYMYCRKKRACPVHLAAVSVQLEEGGPHMRFCQQCGKFEPLMLFDGGKRTCRKKLLMRRASVKCKLQQQAQKQQQLHGEEGDEMFWAAQQQQQQTLHCSPKHDSGIADAAVQPEIVGMAVADLPAEVALDQLQQEATATAAASAAAAGAAASSAAAATAPRAAAYNPDRLVTRKDSITASDMSNSSLLAAAVPKMPKWPSASEIIAFSENCTHNALDELLDVLYEECAAAASDTPTIEDPIAAVAAALQCSSTISTSSYGASCQAAYTTHPKTSRLPAAAAAAGMAVRPAMQQSINTLYQQFASLQAKLMHLKQLTAHVKEQQLQYHLLKSSMPHI